MEFDSTKIYGIVGGLGADASAKLYLDIVNGTISQNNERYPAVLVWNIPIKKVDDEALMQEPRDDKNVVFNLLKDAVDRLSRAGANVIGIACNTIHFLIHKLPIYNNVSFLNIVDCTVEKIKNLNVSNVGLLATTSTIKSGIYSNPLSQHGINVILPNENDQRIVVEIIFKVLEKREDSRFKDEIKRIIKAMGVTTVILGCTELPLIFKQSDIEDVIVIDTIEVLRESMMNATG
jgi:aspartate racemase